LLFHDLRRTVVRNMRKSNVPQVIRMKISGHKTDSMERRYNIADDTDLQFAKTLIEQRQNVTEMAENVAETYRSCANRGDQGQIKLLSYMATIPGDTRSKRLRSWRPKGLRVQVPPSAPTSPSSPGLSLFTS